MSKTIEEVYLELAEANARIKILEEALQNIAGDKVYSEEDLVDFSDGENDPYSMYGGNMDDAFYGGENNAYTQCSIIARKALDSK